MNIKTTVLLITVVLSQTIFFSSTLAGTISLAPSISIIHWKPVCPTCGFGKFFTCRPISLGTPLGSNIF